jgi:UPF0716 protein FxsA
MPWSMLAVLLLVVPIVEIYVIIQVGEVIGAPATIVLLIVESALGAWIVKREGRRAWAALTGSFNTGRPPTRELADAALVLVGGTLLLTPGFVTDVVGFFFVLPFTRPLARRGLSWLVARRVLRVPRGGAGPHGPAGGGGRDRADGRDRRNGGRDRRNGRDGPVVPGEVVDDD